MDEIKIDHRDGKPRPCSSCEDEIQEALNLFESDEDTGIYTYILDTDLPILQHEEEDEWPEVKL